MNVVALKANSSPEVVRQVFGLSGPLKQRDTWVGVSCPCGAHSRGDRSESGRFKFDENPTLHCHVSGESWDQIKWLGDKHGLSFLEAARKLAEFQGGILEDLPPIDRNRPRAEEPETPDLKPIWDQLDRKPDQRTLDYLNTRGLGELIDTDLLRFIPGDTKQAQLRKMRESGHTMVSPLWRGSKLQSFQFRYPEKRKRKKTLNLPGHKIKGSCFGDQPRPENRSGVFVEGDLDAAATRMALDAASFTVYGLPGKNSNGLAERVVAPGREFFIILDADNAGRAGALSLAIEIHALGGVPHIIDLGSGDIGDTLQSLGSIEALGAHLCSLISYAEAWAREPTETPRESLVDFLEDYQCRSLEDARNRLSELLSRVVHDGLQDGSLTALVCEVGVGKTYLTADLAVRLATASIAQKIAFSLANHKAIRAFVDEHLLPAFEAAGITPIEGLHYSIRHTTYSACILKKETDDGVETTLPGRGIASEAGALSGAVPNSICDDCKLRHCVVHPNFSNGEHGSHGVPFEPNALIIISTDSSLDGPTYRLELEGRVLFVDEAKAVLRKLSWDSRETAVWVEHHAQEAANLAARIESLKTVAPFAFGGAESPATQDKQLQAELRIAKARHKSAELIARVLRRTSATRDAEFKTGNGNYHADRHGRETLVGIVREELVDGDREELQIAASNPERFSFGGRRALVRRQKSFDSVSQPTIHILAAALLAHLNAEDDEEYRRAGELQVVAEYDSSTGRAKSSFRLLPALSLPSEPSTIICLDATADLTPWCAEATDRLIKFYRISLPSSAERVFVETKRLNRRASVRNGKFLKTAAEYSERKLDRFFHEELLKARRSGKTRIRTAILGSKAFAHAWSSGNLSTCRSRWEKEGFEFVVFESAQDQKEAGATALYAGWYGKHDRGFNNAEEADLLISFTDPTPNLGEIYHEADRLGLERETYMNGQIAATIHQAHGRLRASVRPNANGLRIAHFGRFFPNGWTTLNSQVISEQRGPQKSKDRLNAEFVFSEFARLGLVAPWLVSTGKRVMESQDQILRYKESTCSTLSGLAEKPELQLLDALLTLSAENYPELCELERVMETKNGREMVRTAAMEVAGDWRKVRVNGIERGPEVRVSHHVADHVAKAAAELFWKLVHQPAAFELKVAVTDRAEIDCTESLPSAWSLPLVFLPTEQIPESLPLPWNPKEQPFCDWWKHSGGSPNLSTYASIAPSACR